MVWQVFMGLMVLSEFVVFMWMLEAGTALHDVRRGRLKAGRC